MKKTAKKKKPAGSVRYMVQLDPDVTQGLKQQSGSSDVPLVRLVNRVLRDALKNGTVLIATGNEILSK